MVLVIELHDPAVRIAQFEARPPLPGSSSSTSSGSPKSALTSSAVMPMRSSPVSVDLTIDATLTGEATLTGAAFGFAWLAAGDINVVFAACGFNDTQPIESNSHGKFWYSAVASLATHLNISATAGGAAQNAGTRINAVNARLHLSRNGWG